MDCLGSLIKPSFAQPGLKHASRSATSADEIALATATALMRSVPVGVQGVVFLSGSSLKIIFVLDRRINVSCQVVSRMLLLLYTWTRSIRLPIMPNIHRHLRVFHSFRFHLVGVYRATLCRNGYVGTRRKQRSVLSSALRYAGLLRKESLMYKEICWRCRLQDRSTTESYVIALTIGHSFLLVCTTELCEHKIWFLLDKNVFLPVIAQL